MELTLEERKCLHVVQDRVKSWKQRRWFIGISGIVLIGAAIFKNGFEIILHLKNIIFLFIGLQIFLWSMEYWESCPFGKLKNLHWEKVRWPIAAGAMIFIWIVGFRDNFSFQQLEENFDFLMGMFFVLWAAFRWKGDPTEILLVKLAQTEQNSLSVFQKELGRKAEKGSAPIT